MSFEKEFQGFIRICTKNLGSKPNIIQLNPKLLYLIKKKYSNFLYTSKINTIYGMEIQERKDYDFNEIRLLVNSLHWEIYKFRGNLNG